MSIILRESVVYRCWFCNRLLFEASGPVTEVIALDCKRCGKRNTITP